MVTSKKSEPSCVVIKRENLIELMDIAHQRFLATNGSIEGGEINMFLIHLEALEVFLNRRGINKTFEVIVNDKE